MSKNIHILLSGFVFGLISLFHFLRLTFEWKIIINNLILPSWASGLIIIFGLLFFYSSLNFKKNDRKTINQNQKIKENE